LSEILRPSTLARTWRVHPRTVVQWIRAGRLPAVKSPGGQYRVLRADVHAFCKEEGLADPTETATEVVLVGARKGLPRAVLEILKGTPSFRDPFEALSHVALHPPRAILIEHSFTDALALLKALRRAASLARVSIIVFDIPSKPAYEKLKGRGAKALFMKRDREAFAEAATRAAAS
jgi:excisionase family DNA binding protein